MAQETQGKSTWLHRLVAVYVVCAALLFVVTSVLLTSWRNVVPMWAFGVSFGAAFFAAVISHFSNGRDNWPDSLD